MNERAVDSPLVVVPAAVLYLLLLVPQAGAVAGGVLSPALAGMAELSESDAEGSRGERNSTALAVVEVDESLFFAA